MTSRILHNVGYYYTGYRFSREFAARFLELHGPLEQDFRSIAMRSDPRVVDLYLELGKEKASAPGADIVVTEIPTSLFHYAFIHESDDGYESVRIDYASAAMDLLKEVVAIDTLPDNLRQKCCDLLVTRASRPTR